MMVVIPVVGGGYFAARRHLVDQLLLEMSWSGTDDRVAAILNIQAQRLAYMMPESLFIQ